MVLLVLILQNAAILGVSKENSCQSSEPRGPNFGSVNRDNVSLLAKDGLEERVTLLPGTTLPHINRPIVVSIDSKKAT